MFLFITKFYNINFSLSLIKIYVLVLFSKNKEVADNLLLMSQNKFYNINGLLKNISFKKEDGDKFWKEFLSNLVLNEIQFKLFNNLQKNY